MTKLRLKRTPAERARHKACRAAKQRRNEPGPSSRKREHSDDNRAELEEARFREKLWGALEEDERLDGINTRLNDFAHIPDRWARDQHDLANPQYMDDDEYAEWIREGMWKKKHAREYEEQAKRDAERAAKRAREKQIKAETRHIEKLALEQDERCRKERQRQREEGHRQRYDQRWKALLDSQSHDHGPLSFQDIPWPIFPLGSGSESLEHISPEAVATFLFPDDGNIDEISRRNRDKLKETLLRFHPDKFEGRLMHRILASDVERIREAVGQVARTVNILMSRKS